MISIQSASRSSIPSEGNVVYFSFEKSSSGPSTDVSSAFNEAVEDGFSGKFGQVDVKRLSGKNSSRIIFVGLGNKKEATLDTLRRGSALAARRARAMELTHLEIVPAEIGNPAERAQACTEGVELGLYKYTAFQTQAVPVLKLTSVKLIGSDASEQKSFGEGIKTGQIVASSVNFVRDLVNCPPSDMDPEKMAEEARSVAKGPVKIKIFNKAEIKKMGMGGLLGVNRGSAKDPVFIHLSYKPKGKAKRKIGICGKGITFDSGGLSLKPAKSMETMKDDMSGAATVFSIFAALEKIQPPIEVHGFTPITENMPGGDAGKPGDVFKTMRGKTIEVLNTDAEGRLVLSDALSYACKQDLDEVLDIATLTGACVIALGNGIAGIMGTDGALIERIKNAASNSGEKVWELPLEKDYERLLKSHVADIKNIGPTGVAGTIMGALFLKAFVDEGMPWAHLDIASTAWSEEGTELSPPGGATGVMVRTLINYLMSYN